VNLWTIWWPQALSFDDTVLLMMMHVTIQLIFTVIIPGQYVVILFCWLFHCWLMYLLVLIFDEPSILTCWFFTWWPVMTQHLCTRGGRTMSWLELVCIFFCLLLVFWFLYCCWHFVDAILPAIWSLHLPLLPPMTLYTYFEWILYLRPHLWMCIMNEQDGSLVLLFCLVLIVCFLDYGLWWTNTYLRTDGTRVWTPCLLIFVLQLFLANLLCSRQTNTPSCLCPLLFLLLFDMFFICCLLS